VPIERRDTLFIDRLERNAFELEPGPKMRHRAKMEARHLAVVSGLSKLLPVVLEKLNERCRLNSRQPRNRFGIGLHDGFSSGRFFAPAGETI
jgi:hypothetical protein